MGNTVRSDVPQDRFPTGVPGLDRIVGGGFIPGRSYMIRGQPGVGKTLLGLHFLTADPTDDSLYITLGETAADIKDDATSFDIDVSDVTFLDLTPSGSFFSEQQSYDVFPTSTVEGSSITDEITSIIEERDPDRVFVDPLSQVSFLSGEDVQYRKSIQSFLQYLRQNDSTVLFTSQNTASNPDDQLQFMSDGIINLGYDTQRRNLEVTKFRSSNFESGVHSVRIDDDGMSVYATLRPQDFSTTFSHETISSGVSELDSLLNGGIERGTVTLLSGPSGAGKTTTGTQFVSEAASRGERSVVYLFEESMATFVHRSKAIGIPIDEMIEQGTLAIEEVPPLKTTPEEIGQMVREEVEERDAQLVMIDGVDGFQHSLLHKGDAYARELHGIGKYLQNMGVTTIFVAEVSTVTGDFKLTDHDISYLADNLIFIRYLEYKGALNKAIGVLKKRASDFERTLRQFEITSDGIIVGRSLSDLRGILQGTPEWGDTTDEE